MVGHTLRSKLHISLFHYTKIGIAGEHLRPLFNMLKDFGFNLLMCVLQHGVLLHG